MNTDDPEFKDPLLLELRVEPIECVEPLTSEDVAVVEQNKKTTSKRPYVPSAEQRAKRNAQERKRRALKKAMLGGMRSTPEQREKWNALARERRKRQRIAKKTMIQQLLDENEGRQLSEQEIIEQLHLPPPRKKKRTPEMLERRRIQARERRARIKAERKEKGNDNQVKFDTVFIKVEQDHTNIKEEVIDEETNPSSDEYSDPNVPDPSFSVEDVTSKLKKRNVYTERQSELLNIKDKESINESQQETSFDLESTSTSASNVPNHEENNRTKKDTISSLERQFGLSKIKIINSVQKRPILYNRDQSEYGDTPATREAWEGVAQENKLEVEPCKRMWNLIYERYVWALRTQISRNAPYYLMNKLDFLRPYCTPTNVEPPASKKTHSPDEDRIRFLISLLSEVRQMSYPQLNQFKCGVLDIIEDAFKINQQS